MGGGSQAVVGSLLLKVSRQRLESYLRQCHKRMPKWVRDWTKCLLTCLLFQLSILDTPHFWPQERKGGKVLSSLNTEKQHISCKNWQATKTSWGVFSFTLGTTGQYMDLWVSKTTRAFLNFPRSSISLWMTHPSSYSSLEFWPSPTSLLRSWTICREHRALWQNAMKGSIKKIKESVIS